MPSTKLIIVLVGIPAAGKTKLARELSLTLLPGTQGAEHIEFDQILQTAVRQHNGVFDTLSWQAGRQRLHQAIHIAAGESASKDVIIVDDTMHMRSMRKKCFQIAQRHSCAYCQIYIPCNQELALMRNKRRGPGVEESSIEKIITELENPLKTCCRHDRDTIRYSEGDTLEALETRLRQIWTNYIPQAGSEPKVFLQRNWIHELDLLCRNIISETVHACKTHKHETALRMNQIRQQMLERAKAARVFDSKDVSEAVTTFRLLSEQHHGHFP